MGVHITDDFHTYRVDWNPKKMIFYFDDQPYWSISLDRIMQSPFYKGTIFCLGQVSADMDSQCQTYFRKGATVRPRILFNSECCRWWPLSGWTRSLGPMALSRSWNVGWLGQILWFEWYWRSSRLWMHCQSSRYHWWALWRHNLGMLRTELCLDGRCMWR